MPATRTLADIWGSQLTVQERLAIFIDRFHAEAPKVPSGPRSAGYAECVANIEHFVLDRHPLPPEDFQ